MVHFVHYQGTANADIRSLRYDYNAEGDLGSITYDDGRTVTYEYDQHLMKKAENFDGKGFTMNYDHEENGTPNRMTEIKGYDGPAYYVKSYIYNANYTTIADMHGNTLQYQFNNYGNTISVQDSAGKAVYSKYA